MDQNLISNMAKNISLFTIKAIITAFILFAFLQSYIPSGQLLLIIPEYIHDFSELLNRNNIRKQMIGSLGSTYAVDMKIEQLIKNNDIEMIEYAKEHKKSLRCN
jgi:hypothetical protein